MEDYQSQKYQQGYRHAKQFMSLHDNEVDLEMAIQSAVNGVLKYSKKPTLRRYFQGQLDALTETENYKYVS